MSHSVLHMAIYHKLCKAENLSDQVEGISKSRFFPFLGCERFDRFKDEVVVKVEIIQISPVNDQIQHVEALSTELQPCLNPVDLGILEILCARKCLEKRAFVQGLWLPPVQRVE